jgi:DNA transformation protein and related proteins
MSLDGRLAALVEELFRPLGIIVVRRMFSGGGVYCDGLMFGLIAGNVVYLKADARSRKAFAAEGATPFVYQGRNKPVAMSYWRLPERLLDEPDEALEWGREAVRAARDAVIARAKKRPRGSR